MVAAWGITPWIAVSLAAMAVMLALRMGVTGRRLGVIRRTASAAGGMGEPMPGELGRLVYDPVLWVAAQMAGTTALGIVFLMTAKPDLAGSLVTVAVALALGVVAGAGSARRSHCPAMAGAAAIASEKQALG